MNDIQFDRLVARMWKKFEAFERIVQFGTNSEILKGGQQYESYLQLRDEVKSWAGQFPHKKVTYPN